MLMKDGREISAAVVNSLNKELVGEARAVCHLLPIAMPYQYKLPFSFKKLWFYIGFMTRFGLHKVISKKWFHASAIFEIQDDPPKKYVSILEHHHQNSRRIILAMLGMVTIVGICIFLATSGAMKEAYYTLISKIPNTRNMMFRIDF